MKVVELSNKTYLIRHWGRWYRVQRAGSNWARLSPLIKGIKPPQQFNLDRTAADLKKRGSQSLKPPIDLTE